MLSSANALNLDKSQILSYGKELTDLDLKGTGGCLS